MAIQVHTVSDRRGMTDFIRLAAEVYRDDANWVAPLNANCGARSIPR